MTEYEIVDQVSRFVERFGMIMDPKTMNTARDEAKEYEFRKISTDHYAVRHGAKMYVIIERDEQIGCSCEAMTFDTGGVCKHIIAFSRLMERVEKMISDLDKAYLMNVCGWSGDPLHPEIELGGPGARDKVAPDPDLDIGVDDPLPEKPVKVSVTCQYCKMAATRKDQKAADAWLKKHETGCPKNPANQKESPRLGTPEEPKSATDAKTATVGATTALSTGFPDQRTFTNAKVKSYVENRGGFYKAAGGKEIPDSAAMSIYALDACRISTETILIEKDADQAKAIVRGHKGDVFVDASVILRFDVLRRRELLKMAKKYSAAIIGWSEEMMPMLDLNFMLQDRTPMITLGEHMINFAIDQEQFADRTAETLARRRVFDMLSGVDWRDAVEVQSEDDDATSMGSKKR